jgi:phage terminase small subunit
MAKKRKQPKKKVPRGKPGSGGARREDMAKSVPEKAGELPAAPTPQPEPAKASLRDSEGLLPRQALFVLEYMKDLNATQAAIRAGYSVRNADKIGPELLGNPRVNRAIARRMAKRAARLNISAERIVQELARVGFSDLTKVAEWSPGDSPRLKDSNQIDPDDAAAIKSVSYSETNSYGQTDTHSKSVTIQTHDKVKALELLAKHLGVLEARPDPAGEELKAALEALDQEEKNFSAATEVTSTVEPKERGKS